MEVSITRNENAIYDVHIRTTDKELAQKIHSQLLKEFEQEKYSVDLDEMRKITKPPEQEAAELINELYNKQEASKKSSIDKLAEMQEQLFNKEQSETKEELFNEDDFRENYGECKDFGESDEEAGKKAVEEEREKSEKRKSFYNKVLYYISKESISLYSLLSAGYPVSSEGSNLIVNLPDEAYKSVMADKRVDDVVLKAIKQAVNNSNVRIIFNSEGDIDIEQKIKQKLDAEKVE